MRWQQANENDYASWHGYIGERLAATVTRYDSRLGQYFAAFVTGLGTDGDRLPGHFDTIEEAMRAAGRAKYELEQQGP